MRRLPPLVLLCLSLPWGPFLQAQTGRTAPAPGQAVSLSLGRAWLLNRGYSTVSLQVSSIRPAHTQPEFGLTILRESGNDRLALADLGLNYSSRSGPALVLIRAGAASIFQLRRPGGAVLGVHAGFSILPARGWGPRLDVTRRYYLGADRQVVPLWSVGLGLSWGRVATREKAGG